MLCVYYVFMCIYMLYDKYMLNCNVYNILQHISTMYILFMQKSIRVFTSVKMRILIIPNLYDTIKIKHLKYM